VGGGQSEQHAALLDRDVVEVVVAVLVLVLAPVDGAELEEAELGGIAAQAGGAALRDFGGAGTGAVVLGHLGEGLGRKRLLCPLDARVRLGDLGGQGEEGRGPTLSNLWGELHGLLAQLAELLGGWGRHF